LAGLKAPFDVAHVIGVSITLVRVFLCFFCSMSAIPELGPATLTTPTTTTEGLTDEQLQQLPVTESYARRRRDGDDDDTDEPSACAVCLDPVLEGQRVRILSRCEHVFHVQCIDPWLRTKNDCPSCRKGVVATP
jgi:hypothetical protein